MAGPAGGGVMSYTGAVPGTEPAGQWVKQGACRAANTHGERRYRRTGSTRVPVAR
jgi:hypothetical protein